jgi:hypothetical protein
MEGSNGDIYTFWCQLRKTMKKYVRITIPVRDLNLGSV